jgi:hypothetical protein
MSYPFNKKLVGFSLLSLTLVFHLSSAPLMAGGSDDESDEDELVIEGGRFDIPEGVIQQVITDNPMEEDVKVLTGLAASLLEDKNVKAIEKSIRKALNEREGLAGQEEPLKSQALATKDAGSVRSPRGGLGAKKDVIPVKRQASDDEEDEEEEAPAIQEMQNMRALAHRKRFQQHALAQSQKKVSPPSNLVSGLRPLALSSMSAPSSAGVPSSSRFSETSGSTPADVEAGDFVAKRAKPSPLGGENSEGNIGGNSKNDVNLGKPKERQFLPDEQKEELLKAYWEAKGLDGARNTKAVTQMYELYEKQFNWDRRALRDIVQKAKAKELTYEDLKVRELCRKFAAENSESDRQKRKEFINKICKEYPGQPSDSLGRVITGEYRKRKGDKSKNPRLTPPPPSPQ